MKTISRRLMLAGAGLVGGLASLMPRARAASPSSKCRAFPSGDHRWDMISSLGVDGPHRAQVAGGTEARLFDRFIGTWKTDFRFIADDGSVQRTYPGLVIMGWIIDGHAIQDIWLGYPEGRAFAERFIGTTVRFFDQSVGAWRQTFTAPQGNLILQLQGKSDGDRIVLHGLNTDGQPIRWSFNEIRSESFTWRGEDSNDQGSSWKVREEHHMKRMP